jgi:hypothetical protein
MGVLNKIRMAGTALGNYATSPETAKALAQRIALDTAIGTAGSQLIPRIQGMQPQPLAASVGNAALGSVLSSPVAGAATAMGVHPGIAGLAGTLSAAAGMSALSNMQQPSRSIDPEINESGPTHLSEYMQLQQFHAGLEQQRYNNEIMLARIKNSKPESTEVVHRNPSAEFESVRQMMMPDVYYG